MGDFKLMDHYRKENQHQLCIREYLATFSPVKCQHLYFILAKWSAAQQTFCDVIQITYLRENGEKITQLPRSDTERMRSQLGKRSKKTENETEMTVSGKSETKCAPEGPAGQRAKFRKVTIFERVLRLFRVTACCCW